MATMLHIPTSSVWAFLPLPSQTLVAVLKTNKQANGSQMGMVVETHAFEASLGYIQSLQSC